MGNKYLKGEMVVGGRSIQRFYLVGLDEVGKIQNPVINRTNKLISYNLFLFQLFTTARFWARERDN